MEYYKKLKLITLVILIVVTISGCDFANDYQKGIFDDDIEIIKTDDSFIYLEKLGKDADNKKIIEFKYFTGMDTIYYITANEDSEITINFESNINKGDFKVVLISPDYEIITILYGNDEVGKTISVKKGESRIKIIGKEASGKVGMNIKADENVEIKSKEMMALEKDVEKLDRLFINLEESNSLEEIINQYSHDLDGAYAEGYGSYLYKSYSQEGIEKFISLLAEEETTIIKGVIEMLFSELSIQENIKEINSIIDYLDELKLDDFNNKELFIVHLMLSEAYVVKDNIQ
ncbi:hypothetical protein ACF3M2_19030 [Tissierella carlieri]|uniref:hypothetical protein n=1 Tax=Tissierella carlieri TaxID=689904 RepID=UPI00386F02A1